MRCTRSVAADPTTKAYTVTVNTGVRPFTYSPFNAAFFSGNTIGYGIATDRGCTTQWTGPSPGATLGGTITFSSSNDFAQKSDNPKQFWACIQNSQNPPAGTYTDTITMTPSMGTPATFPVSIDTPSACSISTPPGNLLFTYAAFQVSPAVASTGFSTTCNNKLPYSMALDLTGGVLLGLNYTLSLSANSAKGTGFAQNFTIDGSLAGGQAGTCAAGSCSSAVARTLTITY
jgi:spore coat protein U-like protein